MLKSYLTMDPNSSLQYFARLNFSNPSNRLKTCWSKIWLSSNSIPLADKLLCTWLNIVLTNAWQSDFLPSSATCVILRSSRVFKRNNAAAFFISGHVNTWRSIESLLDPTAGSSPGWLLEHSPFCWFSLPDELVSPKNSISRCFRHTYKQKEL